MKELCGKLERSINDMSYKQVGDDIVAFIERCGMPPHVTPLSSLTTSETEGLWGMEQELWVHPEDYE